MCSSIHVDTSFVRRVLTEVHSTCVRTAERKCVNTRRCIWDSPSGYNLHLLKSLILDVYDLEVHRFITFELSPSLVNKGFTNIAKRINERIINFCVSRVRPSRKPHVPDI
jgi:hypothetical protein